MKKRKLFPFIIFFVAILLLSGVSTFLFLAEKQNNLHTQLLYEQSLLIDQIYELEDIIAEYESEGNINSEIINELETQLLSLNGSLIQNEQQIAEVKEQDKKDSIKNYFIMIGVVILISALATAFLRLIVFIFDKYSNLKNYLYLIGFFISVIISIYHLTESEESTKALVFAVIGSGLIISHAVKSKK